MAYNKFSLEKAVEDLHLELADWHNVTDGVKPMQPSQWLQDTLSKMRELGLLIGTEKSRSEMIVAPILVELREQLGETISVFSGKPFNVDAARGLVGTCDFLISRGQNQRIIEAPVVAVTEAKKHDLELGIGQCAAEMFAAKIFNERKKRNIPIVYGVVTTGELWQFMKLEGNTLHIQIDSTHIDDIDEILGLLFKIVSE
ncbi:MAG: hypothetical protein ACK4Q5_19175 [Saprospiraceae bacterium]